MTTYDHQKIEKKWKKRWEESGIYKTPEDVTSKDKYYILPQLPYPSGSGLHAGHAEIYSACDIITRFKRMKGKKVLQVIGWDAFGLPAENYAIKTNIHPRINTDKAIDTFRGQIKNMGVSVDWDREVGSHNPDYYKWTQWFFLLMYNQGLAYRKKQKVNWCDSCKTVLANEQVVEKDGKDVCERCDSEIEYKMMEQWYLKITQYADRLAKDLDKVDWPAESVKRQRDWIGRKEGINIKYQITNSKLPAYAEASADRQTNSNNQNTNSKQKQLEVEVFTTRPDTNFGATFIVISPEHPLVSKITTEEQSKEVEEYIKKASKKTEIERTDMTKEKTGAFTGSYAINSLNDYKMPIYVADYVLMDYGTGAVVGVPGHDIRDFDFAKKYDLEIIRVVVGSDGDKSDITKREQVQEEEGKMINSDFLDGMDIHDATEKIMDYMEEQGYGERVVTYKLRDWSVSRQRFWGAPIPFLHRKNGNSKFEIRNSKHMDKPDLFINFHAWASDSKSTYHPWIEKQLKDQGVEVLSPDLPNAEKPVLGDWLETIGRDLPSGDLYNTVVCGRSLGGWAAMKFVENHKVRKLILVAPSTVTPFALESWKKYAKNEEILNTLKSFIDFEKGGNIDFKKVKENAGEILLLISRNDPYIDYQETIDFLKEKLGNIRVMSFRDSGHFKLENGYKEFPKLLEEITKEVRPDLKPIPESDLPVILPDDVDFKPTGQSPLTYSKAFKKGVEEKYGKGWEREPDTLDTFMCSSWYYYRYLDPYNDKAFASPEALKKWMPVDFYLGGPEHVNGHLLYSRFFTKVLYDAGYIDFDEPFLVHKHQGLVLGEDNRKMSKRWGNIINPNDMVDEHGADTFRMYEMFMGPLEEDKPWSSKGIMGVRRFLDKVWRLQNKTQNPQPKADHPLGEKPKTQTKSKSQNSNPKQQNEINKLIKKVESDIENLSFNTAIAKMMEFVNFLSKEESIDSEVWEKFLKVLAPFAPFIAEELWTGTQNFASPQDSIHTQSWPKVDEGQIKQEKVTIAVQINGKTRGSIQLDPSTLRQAQGSGQAVGQQGDVEETAKKLENVAKHLEGKEILKVIYVEGKILSFVVK